MLKKVVNTFLLYLLLLTFIIVIIGSTVSISRVLSGKYITGIIIFYQSLKYLLDNFFATNVVIILLLYSFIVPRLNQKLTTETLIYPFFAIMVFATGMATLNNNYLQYVLDSRYSSYNYTRLMSERLLDQAQSAIADKNDKMAVNLLEQYIQMHPDDEEIQQLLFLRERSLEMSDQNVDAKISQNLQNDLTYYSYEKLIELSQKEKKPVVALNYLLIAKQMKKSDIVVDNLIEIQRDKISKLQLTEYELSNEKYYDKKKEYLNLLLSGDPIRAYYGFKNLILTYPNDLDLEKYYYMSLGTVKKKAFFISEAKKNLQLEGKTNLFFINSTEPLEIITASKMVNTNHGTYWQDLNIYRYNKDKITIHIISPYAKLIEDSIYLRALDEDSFEDRRYPILRQGLEVPIDMVSFKLNIDVEKLMRLPSHSDDLKKLSLSVLINFYRDHSYYPYDNVLIEREILNRIVYPFSFFIFFIGWSYFSYRFRLNKWSHLFTFGLVTSIVFFLLAQPIEIIYNYSFYLITGILLQYFQLGLAIIGTILMFFIILLILVTLWVKTIQKRAAF
ncbi:hypothetical protein [Spirochaeta cellobiosiphila]|uniref:hypothetical protein n=1 Tax=Spirochaeta cellobiosiphila TaxID=504483 RepID=UPI00041526CC|nr:hypothetical protein [Spirochaeta cellobiosiphila]